MTSYDTKAEADRLAKVAVMDNARMQRFLDHVTAVVPDMKDRAKIVHMVTFYAPLLVRTAAFAEWARVHHDELWELIRTGDL